MCFFLYNSGSCNWNLEGKMLLGEAKAEMIHLHLFSLYSLLIGILSQVSFVPCISNDD